MMLMKGRPANAPVEPGDPSDSRDPELHKTQEGKGPLADNARPERLTGRSAAGSKTMPAPLTTDGLVRSSTFSAGSGCDESFISVVTPEGLSFPEALADLTSRYSSALQRLGLSDATAVFCRIFLSDILNQKHVLLQSPLFKRLSSCCALSIIEQKPVGSGPLALLSSHLGHEKEAAITKQLSRSTANDWRNDLLVKGRNYSLLLTANHTGGDRFSAYAQTQTIFESLNASIEQNGMSLLDNGIRTWIYVRDLDNHYKDMVRARREYFAAHGLTDQTRYLASTGILGITYSPEKIVSVDSLSVGGLAQGQIVRMEALSHLKPTILYGVTFERGLRVRFGDRSHLYISGTASINSQGEVLHDGDAERQTRRAVENIRALLRAQSATLDDMAYVIAYVRNAHDRHQVGKVLGQELDSRIPLVFTEAAVCRPAWLMELEGVAIIPDKTDFPPFL
jgi:enamine deaminase RidA (YjgF/YER057c/UK114 family)